MDSEENQNASEANENISGAPDINEIDFKIPTLPGFRMKVKNKIVNSDALKESKTLLEGVDVVDVKNSENESKSKIDEDSIKEEPSKNKNVPFSPAEKLKQMQMASSFAYKEPTWGGVCESKYKLEVIKEGTNIEDISIQGKSLFVFGRLQSCDHQMDHPSISRHHAVFQYRPSKDEDDSNSSAGWYLYDLDSTHGTFVNKRKVESNIFVRLRVGHVVKFGGSTRVFVLGGPEEDSEEETEMSYADMKKMKEEAKLAQKLKELADKEEAEKQRQTEAFHKRNEFCAWGMGDDAVDDDPHEENPFSKSEPTDESFYIDDPKKSIKGFFEREGLDGPEYEFLDDNTTFNIGSRRRCRLELPIDSNDGKPVYAEASMDGKKKDAVVACALEACRILDKMGLLRKAVHESRAKKRKNWADNDYYDSDDDTFFDRTGDIEKKREKRMKKEKPQKSETFESLTAQLEDVVKEMTEIEKELAKDEEICKKAKESQDSEEEYDALDAFMKTVKLGGLGARTKLNMKSRLTELKHKKTRLESLVAIARPYEAKLAPSSLVVGKRGSLGLFGKANFSKMNLPKSQEAIEIKDETNDVIEEEDEDVKHSQEPVKTTEAVKILKTTEVTAEKESLPTSKKQTSKDTEKALQPKKRKSGVLKTEQEFSSDSSAKKVFSATRDQKDSKATSRKRYTEDEPSWLPPDESTWLPPEGQSGDGRTELNDKYGY